LVSDSGKKLQFIVGGRAEGRAQPLSLVFAIAEDMAAVTDNGSAVDGFDAPLLQDELPPDLILDSKKLPRNPTRRIRLPFDKIDMKKRSKTFCILCCSLETVANFTLVLLTGGGMLYMLSLFLAPDSGRELNFWLLVHLFIGIGAIGLAVYHFLQLLSVVKCWKANQPRRRRDVADQPCCIWVVKLFAWLKRTLATSVYVDFMFMNGKYYLVSLATFELVGKLQQVYLMVKFYLCRMSVGVTGIVSLVLLVDLLVQVWASQHIESSRLVRNRKYLVCIVTNVFVATFPLAYSWFNFHIPYEADYTLFFLAGYPAGMILSKASTLWKDMLALDRQRVGIGVDRTRGEVLNDERNTAHLALQLQHFPVWLRKCFKGANMLLVAYFVTVLGIQLTTWANMSLLDLKCNALYTKEVWDACRIKVPFCQYSFSEKCDCAVFALHNYSRSTLPESTKEMFSLLVFGVYKSPVMKRLPASFGDHHPHLQVLRVVDTNMTVLPENIGNLRKLNVLWAINCNLTVLPDTISRLQMLLELRVNGNKLTALPENLGDMTSLLSLWVYKNRLRTLPSSIGKLSNLLKIIAFNNELETLPNSIGQLRHQMKFLYVYNNRLTALPANFADIAKLEVFYAWNNRLTTLPSNVGKLIHLRWVDLRHNRLAHLPTSIREWDGLKYFFAGGNAFCKLSFSFPNTLSRMSNRDICQEQCAMDCPASLLANDYCEDNDLNYFFIRDEHVPVPDSQPVPNSGCNTKDCHYSNNHCPRPSSSS
jgi:Leucine-rich repeat (LRR) protein